MEGTDYEDLIDQFHSLQLHSPISSTTTISPPNNMEATSTTTVVTVARSPVTSPTQATMSPVMSPSKFVTAHSVGTTCPNTGSGSPVKTVAVTNVSPVQS